MFTRVIKGLLLTAISVVLVMSLSAQTIDWGEDIETNKLVAKIVGETDDGHYALAYKTKAFYLEKYVGATKKLKFSKKLELPMMNGKKVKMGNVYLMEDQLVMFTWQYDKPNRKYNVYGYLLGEDGKIPKDHIEILSVDVEKKARQGEFYIKLSRDKSKMLLLHSAPHKRGEQKWVINMRVLTSQLFIIQEMEEEFPLRDKRDYYSVSSYVISDEGGVYMAARKLGWSKAHKLVITKEMTVYMYDPGNGFEVRKIPVELGDKSASSILMDLDREGNLIGGGFYGERTPRGMFKYEGIKGSYFIKINRITEEVEISTTEDFTQDFASKILKEKQAAKGKLVPNYFVPKKIILREDGGAVIIAEMFVYIWRETNVGSTETWQHGPVLVVSMDAEGNQEWVRAIPKNQIYTQTNLAFGFFGGISLWIEIPTSKNKSVYHSFVVGVSGENIQLIYNDHFTNIELSHFRDTKALNGFRKAVPVSVIISPDGDVKKEVLADRDKKEVVLRPKVYFQDGYDHVLIYGNKRGKDKFGTITF